MEGAQEGKGVAGKSHRGSSANKRTPQSGSGRRCQVISGSQTAAAVVSVKQAQKALQRKPQNVNMHVSGRAWKEEKEPWCSCAVFPQEMRNDFLSEISRRLHSFWGQALPHAGL